MKVSVEHKTSPLPKAQSPWPIELPLIGYGAGFLICTFQKSETSEHAGDS